MVVLAFLEMDLTFSSHVLNVLSVDSLVLFDYSTHLLVGYPHTLVFRLMDEVAGFAKLATLNTMIIFAGIRFWSRLPLVLLILA